MRLLLIRHADSIHSREGRIADVGGCRGLTETGVAQSQALQQRFAASGELSDCRVLLSSPVRRARFEPRHTALTVWEHDGAGWRLERYNDAWHLDAAAGQPGER